MGSISIWNYIDAFIEDFHERFEAHFAHLVGLKIVELKEVFAGYVIEGTVVLSNGEEHPVHHRWASEEEEDTGVEMNPDYETMDSYYSKNLIGKEILSVRLGYTDRDDEVYLLAHVNDEHCLAIPVGFDPESVELHNKVAKELISDEEFRAFKYRHGYNW